MGVFGDWAEKYFDLGINVIPIAENKAPPKGSAVKHWFVQKQTEEDIARLCQEYGHSPGIAIVCGPVSGICGFDFDYKFDEKRCLITHDKYKKDALAIERSIELLLPPSPIRKKGKTGWTVFYKNHPSFKTITCDRHGLRLFDFKASGYIVIPPSFHSREDGEDLYYKWLLGDPMEEFSNLPSIDLNVINEIKFIYGSKASSSTMNNRHGRLFLYIKAISKLESNIDVIVEKAMQKDLDLHISDPKGPYFQDRTHVSGDPKTFAKRWVERIQIYNRDNSHKESSAEIIEQFDYFFENSIPYGSPMKDILSEKVFYRHPAKKIWASAEELLPAIKCYAAASGLKASWVEDHFRRWEQEKSELSFLCDIPSHDGTDHLRAHVQALKSDYYTTDEMYLIFQNWGYHLFARIYDSNNQNRCLIIKGNQGIGKDDWIKAMIQSFQPYYVELAINREPTEMISAVQKAFICHMAEFDQTKKLDVAFIKALITNATNFFREKYARVATQKNMHASFISSVNVEDILRDTTGNRRFVILPIESISWNYPKPGLRILSQFKANFEQGVGRVLPDELEVKIAALVDSYTPENVDDEIEGFVMDRLKFMMNGVERIASTSSSVVTIISDAARLFGVSQQRVRRILKPYKSKSDGVRYYTIVRGR